jgi:hypothetical protein
VDEGSGVAELDGVGEGSGVAELDGDGDGDGAITGAFALTSRRVTIPNKSYSMSEVVAFGSKHLM